MATLLIKLSLPGRDAATLVRLAEWSSSSPDAILNRVNGFLEGFMGGAERPGTFNLSVVENGTQATQTLTFTSVVATNTFSIAGTTFTCVASGATGNQFNIGGSDTLTAASAAAAINASATAIVNQSVTATSAATVLTVKGINYDATANAIAIVGSANIVAGGAALTGGVRDSGYVTITK